MNTEQLIKDLSKEPLHRKAVLSHVRIFWQWLLVSCVFVAAMLAIFGIRPDLSAKLQDRFFLAEIITLAAITLSTAFSAAILSFPDLYQKKTCLYIIPASMLAFMVSLLFAYLENSSAPLPIHSFICLLCITMFSIFPAAWMFILLRKQATTHQKLTGSTALLAACSIGALTLRLSEETDSVEHLILWHYLPMIGYMLLGAWLGKKLLKW